MSEITYQFATRHPAKSAVEPVELFPDTVKAAFDRLEQISSSARAGAVTPSADNVEWAKRVLLRVFPRHFLVGAEIDAFQGEIHVNWERGNKRVTVFLPSPNQISIYCEQENNGQIEHHLRRAANDPWEVSGVLRWYFA